jgi:hypothetical protein
MNKEQKRLLILLAILLSAVIYWLYDRQKGSYRMPKKTPQVVVKPIGMPLTSHVATQRASANEPVSAPEVKVVRIWGRDPFQPPDGIEIVKKTLAAEQTTQEQSVETTTVVTCIFIKGSQKIATIGDKNCCEGDLVGDEKVVEILPDRVILEKGKARREILLEDETISVLKTVK